MGSITPLSACRCCGGIGLIRVVDLGEQYLTGVFPRTASEVVSHGPLRLIWCDRCHLVQLDHSYDAGEMYGDNYGYRSGLNRSMVEHLSNKCHTLERVAGLKGGDLVIDIGSNDGTLLKSYHTSSLRKVGVDPTAGKFRQYYEGDAELVVDFFSRDRVMNALGQEARAKLITSIAMFYDLEDPVAFARDIHHVLADDGLWHFEQSYMPWMLRSGAYDTICHEHLEYYSLTTIKRVLDEAGFIIVDVATNAVNGGSISVTAAKAGGSWTTQSIIPAWLLEQEKRNRVHELDTWARFADVVRERQTDLRDLLTSLKASGKTIMGLGASTKGNVLLQTTPIGPDLLTAVGDVNPYKFGRFLPGTGIPIISEAAVLEQNPDYLLILPWHFRETFMVNLEPYLASGGRLIFPLPDIEVVGY